MIPHAFCQQLCTYLEHSVPGLHAYCHTSTGALQAPYAVLGISAEEERVKRNHTWDVVVAVEVHAKARETTTANQHGMFRDICAALSTPELRDRLNDEASDFYLYALRIDTIEEPATLDDSFTQTARLRALIQF